MTGENLETKTKNTTLKNVLKYVGLPVAAAGVTAGIVYAGPKAKEWYDKLPEDKKHMIKRVGATAATAGMVGGAMYVFFPSGPQKETKTAETYNHQ